MGSISNTVHGTPIFYVVESTASAHFRENIRHMRMVCSMDIMAHGEVLVVVVGGASNSRN